MEGRKMQGRKVFSLFNKYLVVICLFAPVMLTLTTPATAEDDEYKGWFGVLDLALTQPNSLDQHFARSFDLSGPILQSDRSVVDNDDDSTFRVGIGYSWGRLGNLKVSYWEFDNNDSQIANLSGYIYPTVSGFVQDVLTANYAYLYNYPAMPAKATSNVEARTLDLDYVRPIAIGENFTLKWLAGLRVADYEEDQAVDGDSVYYGYFTYPVTFQETKHIESKAFGFRVGATGVFSTSPSHSLTASTSTSQEASTFQVRSFNPIALLSTMMTTPRSAWALGTAGGGWETSKFPTGNLTTTTARSPT